jgi:hypothetical protein
VVQQREKEATKTEQMKQELVEWRLQSAKDATTKETDLEIKLAMVEAKLAESREQREQEQAEAQAARAELEARISELESSC